MIQTKLLILFLCAVIVLTSCQKDKEGPIIKIDSKVFNEMQSLKGDTLFFEIEALDKEGIKEIKVLRNGEELASTNSSTLYYQWYSAIVDTGRYHFTITATDYENNKTEAYLWVYFNNFTFVLVEGGSFYMGSDSGDVDEEPVHLVNVNSFEIMDTEVTMGQFVNFLNDINCPLGGIHNGVVIFKRVLFYGEEYPYRAFYPIETYSIEAIPWSGANAFAQWLGGRLPTEAEWEFAARGGNLSEHYIYSGTNNSGGFASSTNWSGFYKPRTYLPNELGIYDMSGGVREWCSDIYSSNYYRNSPTDNPQGPNTPDGDVEYRVVRGGSWMTNIDSCKISNRFFIQPFLPVNGVSTGFRVVRDVE